MKNILTVSTFLLICFLSSCVVQDTGNLVSEVDPVSKFEGMEGFQQESYRIQPGDQLDIKFYYNNDLDASIVVRPDGKIALQLVGEVQAAGLTLTEFDEKLTESYSRDLLNPEITVNVRDFQGLRIYVGGEVNNQGFIGFRENMTPLQAVLNAGGFREFADISSTLVIRKDQNNNPVSIVVDLKMVIAGRDNGADFLLLPDDIVYVPKK